MNPQPTTLTLLLLFVGSMAWCQPNLIEFGKIEKSELESKECPIDKGASAMVLFDATDARCEMSTYAMRIITERRVRIKIYNNKGLEYGNVKIAYFSYRKQTKMKDIAAIVYNLDENGNIVTQRMDRKQIFKDKSEEYLNKIAFSIPAIKPGSVIEYRYTKVENYTMGLDPWIIQYRIPVREAFCYVTLDGFEKLKIRQRTNFKIEVFDPNQVSVKNADLQKKSVTLTARNIPPFRIEPFMSSLKDHIPRVEFEFGGYLDSSPDFRWEMLASRLRNAYSYNFQSRQQIPGTEKIVDTARSLKTTEEKVRYLYHFVQQNLEWDKTRSFFADNLVVTWNSKKGTSGDLNLLLLNLLLRSDVQALPIVASTRQNGKVDKELYTLMQFNTVDILVRDTNFVYLLDASARHTSYQVPPSNLLFRDALAVDSTRSYWVSITDERPLRKTVANVLASFDSTYSLTGDAAVLSYDYAKEEIIKKQDEVEEDEEETEKEERNRKLTSLSTWDYSTENKDDRQNPLIEKFKFKYEVTTTGDFYYFNPLFLTSLQTNPFIDESRQTDIDMGCRQYLLFNLSIKLPDDLELESLPENILLRNSDSSIVCRRIFLSEGSQINVKISIDWIYPLFSKEGYPELRDFHKKMYATLSEQIVVRKKKK